MSPMQQEEFLVDEVIQSVTDEAGQTIEVDELTMTQLAHIVDGVLGSFAPNGRSGSRRR